MKPFLQLVAHDLFERIGHDLSHIVLVFPNKRANLFFNEYLANESDSPLWAPASISISDLFQQLTTLQKGDPIRLVCELYKIFIQETHSLESLDEFYPWGELLISDFDDVDKNLVAAHQLFGNLKDLKDLKDQFEYLSSDQREAIHQFFLNFSIEVHTTLKDKFTTLWNNLLPIYQQYQQRLRQLNIAYEGMLHRDALQQLNPESLKYHTYVFIGFNVLNRVEHALFQKLQSAGKALFYWDYDLYYTKQIAHHEAGQFITQNLHDFPNALEEHHFNQLQLPKQIRYLSAATENAQARYLPQWIRSIAASSECEKENAVVLCNESLLLPVLHSIPNEMKNLNVTMGFPLTQTPVYSFIHAALALQIEGYRNSTNRFIYEYVSILLKHPYTCQLSAKSIPLEHQLTSKNRFYPLPSELQIDEYLEQLFTPQSEIKQICLYLLENIRHISRLYQNETTPDNDIFNQLYRESLFQCYTRINRIYSLIENGILQVRPNTLKRLIDKVLTTATIPFHGEPAIGLQVMGVLETRNLDFRNLLILSLNEGQLPKAGSEASFIPYHLRKAFGMTTIEHKNSVYAYYFYRLIQRAENITLVYNTSSDGLNRSEWSRFMLQYLLESGQPITRQYLEAGQSPLEKNEIEINKTPRIIELLRNHFKQQVLSPSALNTYLSCSLRFYFRYVAHLKCQNEVSSEIDSALFGTIFHRSAELCYRYLTVHGSMIERHDIETLLKSEHILQRFVDQAFNEHFFKIDIHEHPEYNGIQLICSKVIFTYLRQLLQKDLLYAPFSMKGMEYRIEDTFNINTPEGPIQIRIGGTIDRIDLKDNILRIVDYKTGGNAKTFKDIEELFIPSSTRPDYIFQAFLYATIFHRKHPEYHIAPALFYIHRAAADSYNPIIVMNKVPVDDFSLLNAEFTEHLEILVSEVFNPDIPFQQTSDTQTCSHCEFKSLCNK